MNLIQRYIFASVLLTCAAAVGLFAFVLVVANAAKDLLGYILAGQLPLGTILELIGLLITYVVTYALPMGMLMGILLVLGRMSSDREITALRASGLSVAWLSAPILFVAILGVGLCLLINFEFMPWARVKYHQELADALRQNPLGVIVPRTFLNNFPDKIVYVGEMRGEQLRDVWVWDLDTHRRVIRSFHANSGTLKLDPVKNQVLVRANDMFLETRKDPENFRGTFTAPSGDQVPYVIPLDDLSKKRVVEVKPRWLTFGQLMDEWRRLGVHDPKVPDAEREKKRIGIQTVIHEKFATAFSVLSFALLAIPLGIKVSRKETSANLGLALVLVMAYYFATIVVSWFDNRPSLRPDLLMWLPNLGFQTLGFWMYSKIDRT